MNTRVEDFQAASRDHFDKISASSAAVTRGLQTVVRETTDYSRRSLESATTFDEKLLGVWTLEAAITLQTDFAKAQFNDLVAQMNKISEIYKGIAVDAFQPVENAVDHAKSAVTH